MSKHLVIYHGSCRDGFASAYIVYTKYPKARFFAGVYGGELPIIEPDEHVIFVDFCYREDVMEQIINTSKSVLVIDHHKSSIPLVNRWPENFFFDENESGATLTWTYFYPNLPCPEIFRYVKDRDLWKFELADSEFISAAIGIIPFEFSDWHLVTTTWYRPDMIRQGQLIKAKIKQYVTEVLKTAFICDIKNTNGHTILTGMPIVCCSYSDCSEVMDAMFNVYHTQVVMSYRQRQDGKFSYSIRSKDNAALELATMFGGGGHPNAAGFETNELIHRFNSRF